MNSVHRSAITLVFKHRNYGAVHVGEGITGCRYYYYLDLIVIIESFLSDRYNRHHQIPGCLTKHAGHEPEGITSGMETGFFDHLVILIADLVWGPHTVLLLLGVSFYLTLRLRFLQLRGFKLSLRLLMGKKGYGDSIEESQGDISPFQAMATSLAAVIGNGNIAGVCAAIALGGPGSVFWMWLAALFGMATKIVEAVLGQKFRQIAPDGTVAGGPMYYITNGLKLPWLAGTFAFFMGGKAMISTTIVQSNSIALALNTQFGLDFWVAGLGLAVLVWLVIIGGIKSIARIAVFLSPFMVFIYIIGAFVCLIVFAKQIPHAFSLIFIGAFNPSALGGGVAGVTVAQAIRQGMAKGAYSNEAGTGTAAVFHAAARTGGRRASEGAAVEVGRADSA